MKREYPRLYLILQRFEQLLWKPKLKMSAQVFTQIPKKEGLQSHDLLTVPSNVPFQVCPGFNLHLQKADFQVMN